MAKTVVMVGMLGPYKLETKGADVWGVNRTYEHQDNLTRIYAMDPLGSLGDFEAEFIGKVSALKIPIFFTKA